MFRSATRGFCSKLSLALALVLISASTAAFGQCVQAFKDIQYKDGIGRIKTYECQARDATVRVVFHRIDEEVIGSLILGQPNPEIQKTLGNFRVITNRVAKKLGKLFKKFGVEEQIKGGYSVSLSVPEGGTEYSGDVGGRPGEDKAVKVLSLAPNGAASREADYFTFPTLLLGKEINDKVKVGYAGGPSYDAVLRAPNEAEKRALEDYFEKECSQKKQCAGKKYMDLARHINRDGFLRISADVGQCEAGEEPTGYVAPRKLVLDLVTIENTSGRQIELNRVVGRASIPPTELRPGEAIGIPLRMEFKVYDTKPIKYGRTLTVRAIEIDNNRVYLMQMLSNSTSQTSGDSGASCPYLYALKTDGSVQQSYGKIIHSAHNRYRKMTEVVQLRQFTTKFMLREEEPERSYIDQAELRLRMKDNSYLRFAPKTASLGKTDSEYAEIPPFTAIEINFELPDWIKEEDIDKATLAITGYYKRVHLPAIEVSATKPSGG